MVDLDWKTKMTTKISDKSHPSVLSFALPEDSCLAYENYLRLLELSNLWLTKEFPDWKNEALIKPTLQALELTFQFISLVLSDPRPYTNRKEWTRRLESLTIHQIELIANLCEDHGEDIVPTSELSTVKGVLARDGSLSEVWKLPGATPVVNRTSEGSYLPRLATWHKSEDVASKILFSIECHMQRLPFTLGLGEPNLTGKPNLKYDLICKPSDLHLLKRNALCGNYENQTLFTSHQILETWIFAADRLLQRIEERINDSCWEEASRYCWLLEKIWRLLAEIEDLHLLMDPDDFLRLKSQLSIRATSESEAFCFRSKALTKITNSSKDLRHKVPWILGVEVDPRGGPRIQESAMKLFHSHKSRDFEKIHLLQAFQAIESAVKKFFFSYRQLISLTMGSLEANGHHVLMVVNGESCEILSQIFLEPPYYPSLDAAKTFLGDFWQRDLH